jgi:hypothetical protein
MIRREHIDLSNQVFGRLTAHYRAENLRGRIRYECQCTCGATAIVRANNLTSGDTRSCGCLASEMGHLRVTSGALKHLKHGLARTSRPPSIYTAWCRARQRHPNVPDFLKFYELIGPKPDGRSRLRRQEDGTFKWN